MVRLPAVWPGRNVEDLGLQDFLIYSLLVFFGGGIGFSDTLLAAEGREVYQNTATQVADSTITPINSTTDWKLGVMGGFLFSTIEGDQTEDHSYLANFSGGFYGSTMIFPPLGLTLELYYARMGTGFVSIADTKRHMNYLVLPILLDYEFRPGISLGVGPYFGFLLNAKDVGDDFTDDITDLLARLDVGVKIGVYFKISTKVGLGVTFNRGFINTQRGGRVGTFKHYNQAIMFTGSYRLAEIIKQK